MLGSNGLSQTLEHSKVLSDVFFLFLDYKWTELCLAAWFTTFSYNIKIYQVHLKIDSDLE